MRKAIYMDYAASTPCDTQVVEKMLPYFTEHFGNASSNDHAYGWEAAEAVDKARQQVADLLHADAADLFFTSGATEAINLGIKGLLPPGDLQGLQVLTNRAEHAAVLDTCAALEQRGCSISYLNLDQQGRLDLVQLEAQLQLKPALLAIQYANNETGVIHPIREIATLAKQAGVPFFCDATQAVGKIPVDVQADGLSLLALSGHKIYGPKGVGALYVQQGCQARLMAQQQGGKQEKGFRSGTLNVPGIVGLGEAASRCVQHLAEEGERLTAFRVQLEQRLLEAIPDMQIHGQQADRLPHISNLYFPDCHAEQLLLKLSSRLALSRGSACSSAQRRPSRVLMAMGLPEEQAHEAIRISMGRPTSAEELDRVIDLLLETLSA